MGEILDRRAFAADDASWHALVYLACCHADAVQSGELDPSDRRIALGKEAMRKCSALVIGIAREVMADDVDWARVDGLEQTGVAQ